MSRQGSPGGVSPPSQPSPTRREGKDPQPSPTRGEELGPLALSDRLIRRLRFRLVAILRGQDWHRRGRARYPRGPRQQGVCRVD